MNIYCIHFLVNANQYCQQTFPRIIFFCCSIPLAVDEDLFKVKYYLFVFLHFAHTVVSPLGFCDM